MSADSYGAWSLVLQLSAYVGYFDFGIQTAVGRFVAHADRNAQRRIPRPHREHCACRAQRGRHPSHRRKYWTRGSVPAHLSTDAYVAGKRGERGPVVGSGIFGGRSAGFRFQWSIYWTSTLRGAGRGYRRISNTRRTSYSSGCQAGRQPDFDGFGSCYRKFSLICSAVFDVSQGDTNLSSLNSADLAPRDQGAVRLLSGFGGLVFCNVVGRRPGCRPGGIFSIWRGRLLCGCDKSSYVSGGTPERSLQRHGALNCRNAGAGRWEGIGSSHDYGDQVRDLSPVARRVASDFRG